MINGSRINRSVRKVGIKWKRELKLFATLNNYLFKKTKEIKKLLKCVFKKLTVMIIQIWILSSLLSYSPSKVFHYCYKYSVPDCIHVQFSPYVILLRNYKSTHSKHYKLLALTQQDPGYRSTSNCWGSLGSETQRTQPHQLRAS